MAGPCWSAHWRSGAPSRRTSTWRSYCPELKIEHGFQVLCTCALHPWVNSAQFVNGPNTPDKTLYWQLRCHGDDGAEWKIDMRSAPEDYALPRGEDLMHPMKDALAPETRAAILALKGARMAGGAPPTSGSRGSGNTRRAY